MHQALGRIVLAQALEQLGRQATLVRAQGCGVPFGAVWVVDRDEGRLAAHGQAYVVLEQVAVDLPAQGLDRQPLFFGVGLGHPWRFPDALHRHLMGELAFARLHQPADGRGGRWIGAAGQGDMPFTGEQPGRGIQANPASAGQIHFAPGVQVGEVHLGTGRAVEGFDVGGQLNQITRDKSRRQPEVAQQLHQQPGRVAAGAGRVFQGKFRGLHTRLHANQVTDIGGQALVEADQEIHSRQRRAVDTGQVRSQPWRQRQGFQIRRQLALLIGGVAERDIFGVGLQEKIERIEHRHLGDQVDFNAQLVSLFREHQARQVIALGVLLPVDEMLLGQHLQRVGQYPRTAMGRRA